MILMRFMRRYSIMTTACLALACSSELPTDVSDAGIRSARGSGGGATKPSGIVVGAAHPNAATRDTTLDVRILGSGFARGMVAKWAIDSIVTPEVVVNSTRFVSSTELVANITVTTDAPLTEYDIVVTSTKGGKPGIGTEIFEIVQELGLGSLGGPYSSASGINESGQIAGYSSLYVPGGVSPDHPVVWENGVIRDLLPAGYNVGRAADINESGQVAGWLGGGPTGGMVPFVWSASTGMRFLPTPPGETQNGVYAINDAGVVAGWSGRAAVVWENGIMRVVHNDPTQWSAATDVNNLGEVIGFKEVEFNGGSHTAWRWSSGSGFQLLSTLDGSRGFLRGINDRGQIVGYGPASGGGSSAFIHENGVARQLASGGFGISNALGISEAGHVVGMTTDGRGVMWLPDGSATIICTAVLPVKGYTTSCGAYAINADGIAVGWKTDKYGREGAFKWSLEGFQ